MRKIRCQSWDVLVEIMLLGGHRILWRWTWKPKDPQGAYAGPYPLKASRLRLLLNTLRGQECLLCLFAFVFFFFFFVVFSSF